MPRFAPLLVLAAACSCRTTPPAPWNGPTLAEPRTQLTVAQLVRRDSLPFVDLSFFARPAWATDDAEPFEGTLTLDESPLSAPKGREAYPGETIFPALQLAFISRDGALIPRRRRAIDTRTTSPSYWDVILGVGRIWREANDGPWSRASFPIQLLGRYVGEVRNCVASFVHSRDSVSGVALQCSQETAVLDAGQLGDIRGMLEASYAPHPLPDAATIAAAYDREASRQLPIAPLSTIDTSREVADHFDRSIHTNASTSLGALLVGDTLYVHPPRTRHGTYPYPRAMRHGVFSVTKSLAGALALFHLAQRYGDDLFDEPVRDHVPAFADRPEWEGVTFAHLLNMVTGVRAGEDLLYEPLELAPDREAAIGNIAAFGDSPEAPGEQFNYATTNTFVLSYALEHHVQAREGAGVHYWDIVHDDVLVPIGAEHLGLLVTRDSEPSARIPILGLGAYPTLDEAAKVARLLAVEGRHDGVQLLSRRRVREALGRTAWAGYPAFSGLRYRHSLWSKHVRVDGCRIEVVYLEGLGDNRIVIFPSGVISFQFTDEFDRHLDELVRSVERIRSSCPDAVSDRDAGTAG